MSQIRESYSIAVMALLVQLLAAEAFAADLEEVQSFGDNPSSTRMFIYVPDTLAASPPVLVAIHYCTGSAQAFFTGTSYHSQADRHGFIVIYPETTASDRCFDVHSPETLKHDGGGESAAIASMVRFTLTQYKANAQRVYVTGTSSGAMMTNVMLGAYPDLFRAGAAFAGVPFGCFAGPDRWNGDCAGGRVTKTGKEWGDLVRAAYPGFSGQRPRMQLWHGDNDETLSFHNFGEEIKQWTDVLGVSEMATSTEPGAPQADWTRTRYADSAGVVQVEAMVGPGMSHNLTVLSDEAVRFFGLDMDSDPADGAAAAGGGAGSSATPSASAGSGAATPAAAAAGSGSFAADSSGGAAGATSGANRAAVGGASGADTPVGGAGATGSAAGPGKAGAATPASSSAASGGAGMSARAAAASDTAERSRSTTAATAAVGGAESMSMQPAATSDSSGCSVSPRRAARPPHAWLLLGIASVCLRHRARIRRARISWRVRTSATPYTIGLPVRSVKRPPAAIKWASGATGRAWRRMR